MSLFLPRPLNVPADTSLSRRSLLAVVPGLWLSGPILAQPVGPASDEPLIPLATIDDDLEIAGDPLDAESRRNRLFISVMVNGEGPFRFLVDSGADRSVVGAALAVRLGLPAIGSALLQSMAGRTLVDMVAVDELSMGGTSVNALQLPALPEAAIGADGLLGIDALADQRILLDYNARLVTVQPSSVKIMSAGVDEIVVTARRRKGQLILTEVRAGPQKLYAVIDSGSEISLGNIPLAARLFSGKKLEELQTITLTAVTGEVLKARIGILPELRVGNLILRGLPVAFADVGPFALFGLDRRPALLLGADVLQAFKQVALDFGNRRVRFTIKR